MKKYMALASSGVFALTRDMGMMKTWATGTLMRTQDLAAAGLVPEVPVPSDPAMPM